VHDFLWLRFRIRGEIKHWKLDYWG